MNNELKHLIQLVKTSSEPVQSVVDAYFKEVIWSSLKAEWNQMSRNQKAHLINKLTKERK